MPNPEQPPKPPSLADYFVYYDLPALLREAKADYSEAASGAPRAVPGTATREPERCGLPEHLGPVGARALRQQDIAARFKKARRKTNPPHEPA